MSGIGLTRLQHLVLWISDFKDPPARAAAA